MLLQILKSKLQKVIITRASTSYQGSITLDLDLMEISGMRPYERVEVNSVNGEHRITTYILPGERGTGQVEMNGGAANFFKEGDEVHVNCFAIIDVKNGEDDYNRVPMIIHTDENNRPCKKR